MNKALEITGALALLVIPVAAQSAGAHRPQDISRSAVQNQALPELATGQLREAGNLPRRRAMDGQAAKPRPMIGVRIAPVDSSVSAQLPAHLMPALILTSIFEDSPAARAGLRVNDVITAVDGNPEVTVETLTSAISGKAPGSIVTLDISRAGQSQVFNVAVEELSPETFAHRSRSIPDLGFLKDYDWQHAWPRFGVRHDGKIMVQQTEGSEWTETQVNSQLHDVWNQVIQGEPNSQGKPYLDLTRPDLDPEGRLRRQLEHLHHVYREALPRTGLHVPGSGPGSGSPAEAHLEARIDRLERKVDDIHRMLEELLERTE